VTWLWHRPVTLGTQSCSHAAHRPYPSAPKGPVELRLSCQGARCAARETTRSAANLSTVLASSWHVKGHTNDSASRGGRPELLLRIASVS
jgi:hypothetical protein